MVYDRYWRRTCAATYARLGDQVVCEDIVQDIFLTLWTERTRLQIAAFPGHLAAAVRYQAARYQRAADASPLRYADALDTLSTDAAHNHGEYHLLYRDLKGHVAAALGQLPPRCREIFLLSRLQHFSNDEIAQRLYISRRSVETRLTTALHHLRLTLKLVGMVWLLVHHA
ncbi:sigma-70 family RNA polymerase sigma factor [Hymenobacter nivis]|uniref:Sigma-70 family RNA polymerase sigma factor n=1 Tax=Hymenobacter nivis TaxID=1850093 RepID=A0A502HFL5_9BACT|nr:sigma-70 family RNA polymerase sigma factor [Hymenobacter nivis]TPG72393.1 sigma-70 family RNA polymerase sigma factor [Hymenobacter nivis]